MPAHDRLAAAVKWLKHGFRAARGLSLRPGSRQVLLAALLAVAWGSSAPRPAGAAIYTWNGAASSLWSNTFLGGTTVNSGTLQLGSNNALGNGGLTVNNGVADVNGQALAAAGLSGTGLVTNSSFATGTLDLNGAAASTFSGSLQNGTGPVALQLDGATLTLAGTNNTHSGPTTINSGSLLAAAANVLSPSSAVTISGGLLDVTAGSQTIAGLTLNSGSLNLSVGKLLNVAGPASLDGTLTLSGTYSGSFIDLLSSTSLSGAFADSNVSSNYPGYVLSYNYGTNQVDLVTAGLTAWSFSAGGNWSASSNWTPSVPDHQGALAILGSNLLTSDTVTLDTPQTVGTLIFANSAAGYTLAGNQLTLDNTGGTAAGSHVLVVAGTHAINAPLLLSNGSLTVTASNGGVLTIGGNITDDNGAESLTLRGDGSGQLVLSGTNTYGGGTSVYQGTLIAGTPGRPARRVELDRRAGRLVDLRPGVCRAVASRAGGSCRRARAGNARAIACGPMQCDNPSPYSPEEGPFCRKGLLCDDSQVEVRS